MKSAATKFCIAFAGSNRIAAGDLLDVAIATKKVLDNGELAPILIFDEESKPVEIDFRGTTEEFTTRIKKSLASKPECDEKTQDEQEQALTAPGPGRPKLGVVAREVTLLPRQWEWLSSQPGGASVTLRKLVEAARKESSGTTNRRRAQEIAYKFMAAMAGNEPGFEEASRALFANDKLKFEGCIMKWPFDVCNHVRTLANDSFKLD